MNKIIKEYEYWGKGFSYIFTIYPYQIAFGISLRIWDEPLSIVFRFYFLCFKLALNIYIKRKK